MSIVTGLLMWQMEGKVNIWFHGDQTVTSYHAQNQIDDYIP